MTKLYYAITEVAESIGVDQSLLLVWEEEFNGIIQSNKNANGIRFYKNEDIEIFKQIHFLVKIQDLSFSDVKQKLIKNKGVV